MSSPITITVGSRVISWSSASLIACFMLILRAMALLLVRDVDVGGQVGGRGLRSGLRLDDRALDEAEHVVVDGLQLAGGDDAGRRDRGGELLQAVALGADLVDFAGAAI